MAGFACRAISHFVSSMWHEAQQLTDICGGVLMRWFGVLASGSDAFNKLCQSLHTTSDDLTSYVRDLLGETLGERCRCAKFVLLVFLASSVRFELSRTGSVAAVICSLLLCSSSRQLAGSLVTCMLAISIQRGLQIMCEVVLPVIRRRLWFRPHRASRGLRGNSSRNNPSELQVQRLRQQQSRRASAALPQLLLRRSSPQMRSRSGGAATSAVLSTAEACDTVSMASAVDKSTSECTVCFEQPVRQRVALRPCGHASFCAECATRLFVCPFCRRRVEGQLSIFLD